MARPLVGASFPVSGREGQVEPVEVDAVGETRPGHALALARQATEDLGVPGLDGGNIRFGRIHVHVIHADRSRQREIAEDLHANRAVRRVDVSLIRIRFSDVELDAGRLPAGARCGEVLVHQSEMIDDRTGGRLCGFGLPKHDEHARKLDQRERSIGDERSPEHRRPERLLRLDVLHGHVNVPQRHTDVVRRRQLRQGRG